MTMTADTPAASESIFRRNLSNFAANRLAMACGLIVVLFAVMAVFAPWIAPHDPNETDLFRRLQPPHGSPGASGPSCWVATRLAGISCRGSSTAHASRSSSVWPSSLWPPRSVSLRGWPRAICAAGSMS
ncbi:MAG: hypothetical protein KDJ82_12875 [Rhodobacteraceae bacterium]|nr:hypothetical protein [Paracoccaceae bacterium]